jgi:hypothetical protein
MFTEIYIFTNNLGFTLPFLPPIYIYIYIYKTLYIYIGHFGDGCE